MHNFSNNKKKTEPFLNSTGRELLKYFYKFDTDVTLRIVFHEII